MRESKEGVILVEEWREGVGLGHQNSFQVFDAIFVVLVKMMELFWAFFFLYKSINKMHQIKITYKSSKL